MSIWAKLNQWLEIHWVSPAYVGWVLLGLAGFFFAAATNTLAGWLYVMSGVLLALLVIAALLPRRNLAALDLQRQPIRPVTAGTPLWVEVALDNPSGQIKTLLQVQDELPADLAPPQTTVVTEILPGSVHRWRYDIPTQRRGFYRWQTLTLRTAAPLGLFWNRRVLAQPISAVVYPQILPLSYCDLIDDQGDTTGQQWHWEHTAQLSTEGITRALRPYRWGDSTRLIHWRTSARYGELRVRELERITAGQQVVIALNTADTWDAEAFEQAVIAAASLYVYAQRQGYGVSLWTPEQGSLTEQQAVMTCLAKVQYGSEGQAQRLPQLPIIWIAMKPTGMERLPSGSRLLVWNKTLQSQPDSGTLIHWIDPEAPLQPQLQRRP